MTDPYALGDGPSLAELELMADVREIAEERDAALALAADLQTALAASVAREQELNAVIARLTRGELPAFVLAA